jgi:F-type H+-transporting ATPase subunit a
MGSPTGALGCTAALAVLAFAVVIGSGVKKMGVLGYLKAQAPHIDLPLPMAIMMIPGIWLIEVFSLLIKHMVLAVRLFANMFAGHLVLAAFVAFIAVSWGSWLKFGIVPTVICSSVMISLLELAVAFIQAYVFTFLTALFIGSALHPH